MKEDGNDEAGSLKEERGRVEEEESTEDVIQGGISVNGTECEKKVS